MSRRTVILCQPRIGYMDEVRSAPALPLSLIHAASDLVREFDVRIVDTRLDSGWRKDLASGAAARPLYVGITTSTGPMIGHALEIARIVRSVDATIPIVWGGTHPTMLPAQTVAHPLVDAVVAGDGERPAAAMARRIAGGGSPSGIPGVMVKGDAAPAPSDQADDLDDYPPAPFHLVDPRRYRPRYLGRSSTFFQSSRGCPHACRYCYNVFAHRRRWRAFSAARVVGQIAGLVREYGVQDIYFVDDNFFIDIPRAMAIARGIGPLGCTWQVQGADLASVGRLSDDNLLKLYESGLRRLTVGIESGSESMRRRLGKEGTVDEIAAMVGRLAPLGIIVFGSFITNLPGETTRDLRDSVRLVERLHGTNPRFRNSPFYSYTPFPGTPMFEDAVKDGFTAPVSLDGWARFSYEGNTYIPNGAPPHSFIEGLYMTSLLNDRKIDDYSARRYLRLLARLYRPVARFRMRHLWFGLMPERYAARLWL
ncbi:MAG: B12-binding domain-containing radical SAM protein [Deltaproteobacteria bacterium]|nr:B12-binding domain-containing radical SAM protein [Deltaproteobacteria bacterium]